MRLRALICFGIVAISTAVVAIGCGGGSDRTRISKRGGGNGDSTTLGKLQTGKCGDKEVLDLNSLKSELEALEVYPSHLYFRAVNSFDPESSQIPDPLGEESEDERFGLKFFQDNMIGFTIKATNKLVDDVSLFSFEPSSDECPSVSITFDDEFFAFDSVISDLDGEGVDTLRDGSVKVTFSIDAAKSGKEQLVLKGPDDIHVVYRVNRGESEVSTLFIAHAFEDFCGTDNIEKHVLEVEQVLTWSEQIKMEKPYISDVKSYLKDSKVLETEEESGTFYEYSPSKASSIQAHIMSSGAINKISCELSGGTPSGSQASDVTSTAEHDSD